MQEFSSSGFEAQPPSFTRYCSDIVVHFKELVSFSDPSISQGKLLEFERKFIALAEHTANDLRVQTQGKPTIDPSTVATHLAELQQSCYNEILEVYRSEGDTRMVGMLQAMKSISMLPIKDHEVHDEEHSPAPAPLRSSLTSSSLLGEAESDDGPLKENLKSPKWVMNQLKSKIGLFTWVPKYNFAKFRGDLVAAIAVGLMIIPQGMAYALLAGMDPIYGLYTAFVPLFVYFVFGSSQELAIGPTAMVSLIIPTAVGTTYEAGSQDYVELVIFYAFCYGVVLFLIGFFKVGFLMENILSRPALSGFTQGASVLIACSQLKNVFGFHPHTVIYTVDNLISGFVVSLYTKDEEARVSWWSFAIGGPALLIILIMKKVKKTFPTIVLVLIVGIITVLLIDKKHDGGVKDLGIKIVGTVPPGLPRPQKVDFSRNDITTTVGALIVLVFIGFVETISVAKKFAVENQYTLSFNQELLALGMCNMIGPWFRAYPVAGSLPRTVVNAHTGAKSPLATLMAAIIVMFMLLFGTKIIFYVPLSVLGAIVMSAALSVVDYSDVKYMWRIGQKLDAVQFIVVAFCTAFFGPIIGVASAGLLSLVQVIYHTGRPEVLELGRFPNTNIFKDIHRFPRAKPVKGVAIISMHAPRLSFYNFPWFREGLEAIEEQHEIIPVEVVTPARGPERNEEIVRLDDEPVENITFSEPKLPEAPADDNLLHTIIWDCTPLDGIDATATQYMREMIKSYHEKGRLFIFAHVKKGIAELLKKSGSIPPADAHKYIFNTMADAVEFALMNGAEEAKAAKEAAIAANAHLPKPATNPVAKAGKKLDKILPVSKLFSAEFSANEISLI